MRVFSSLEELKTLVGREVGVSGWIEVNLARIRQFAEATGDDQWIHLDEARCGRESPYRKPVAHGFLTLSLIPMMLNRVFAIEGEGMTLNYGLNKVRFPSPLPAGRRVRGRVSLLEMSDVEGGAQMVWQVQVESEGGGKPVCAAELITRRYSALPR